MGCIRADNVQLNLVELYWINSPYAKEKYALLLNWFIYLYLANDDRCVLKKNYLDFIPQDKIRQLNCLKFLLNRYHKTLTNISVSGDDNTGKWAEIILEFYPVKIHLAIIFPSRFTFFSRKPFNIWYIFSYYLYPYYIL